MREFIKNMSKKREEKEVPTTLEYRLKEGIKERPSAAPSEAKHIEK